jgi:glycylpeptide N-tetradecanoyltransferase
MTEESKQVDPRANEEAVKVIFNQAATNNDEHDDADDDADTTTADAVAAGSATKKKKSKKAKLKKLIGAGSNQNGEAEGSSGSSKSASKLTDGMVEQLLDMNPSLRGEVAGMDKSKAAETLKKLDVADLLTGLVQRLGALSF